MATNAFELARFASLEPGPRRDKLTIALADTIASQRLTGSRTSEAIGDLLRNLVLAASRDLRLSVAGKLAGVDWAPRELVLSLALDDFDIAEPIITKCRALIEEDLVTIAHQGTADHRRSLAKRDDVTEAVAEAIAEAGEPEVLAELLRNASARLSRSTLNLCVNEARASEVLHEPLADRDGLPPELAEAIYLIVSDELRAHIASRYEVDEPALRRIIDAAAQQVGSAAEDREHLETESAALVRALDESGALTPEFITSAAAEGRIEVFDHAVARLAGMTPEQVRAALTAEGAWAAALACRVCDIPKRNFGALYRALSSAGRVAPTAAALADRTAANTYVSQSPTSAASALRRIVEAD